MENVNEPENTAQVLMGIRFNRGEHKHKFHFFLLHKT